MASGSCNYAYQGTTGGAVVDVVTFSGPKPNKVVITNAGTATGFAAKPDTWGTAAPSSSGTADQVACAISGGQKTIYSAIPISYIQIIAAGASAYSVEVAG